MQESVVTFGSERHPAEGRLLKPSNARKTGVIIAHGAGSGMNSEFIVYFHQRIAEAGFPAMRFNFSYTHQGRKAPDSQNVLVATYERAIDRMTAETSRMMIGGKSLGGRISSYVAGDPRISALFFLGYPLHAPGNTERLRDQHLYSIRKPMFFAQGTRDPFAQPDLLRQVIEQLDPPPEVLLIENGGHSFETSRSKKDPPDLAFVADRLIEWMIRSDG